MAQPLRVLFIEDSDDDARLLEAYLAHSGYAPQSHRVDDAAGLSAALAEGVWDLLIADYTLPNFSGPEALRLAQASGLDLPFIIISGTIDEEQAVSSLKAGAHDFVTKDNLARLVPAIERERREAANRRARRQVEAARREQETSFRLLFANNPLPMWVHDADTFAFVEVNDAALLQYGYTREEFLARRLSDLRPEEEVPRLMAFLGQERPSFHGPEAGRHRLKDGRIIDVEVASHALELGGRRVVLVVAHDVTQSRRQLQRLAGLKAVDAAISGSLDLRLTLNVLLNQVLEQLQVDAASVLLYSPQSQALTHTVSRGFRSRSVEHTRLRLGESYAGRAALQRQPVYVTGLSGAPDQAVLSPLLAGEGFVALHAVPLIAKGQLVGVLEVFRRRSVEPDPDWLSYLEALAGQAAIAIENAKLFEGLQRSNTELSLAYDATLSGWAEALDRRNQEAAGHSQAAADLALRLARALGLDEAKLAHLRRGALLHDVGHLSLPESVLLKPGPLTEAEWAVVRQHPTWAHARLAAVHFLQPALDIPLYHHEKWDGTGYPHGLQGQQIPQSARIFAVADVWLALRTARPHRPAWPADEAREYIRSQAGRHFDPDAAAAFLGLDLGDDPSPGGE